MWFKTFIGSDVAAVIEQGNQFATMPQVNVKSVGVEYVESQKKLVLSLGFDVDTDAVPAKLVAVDLGQVALVAVDVEGAFKTASNTMTGNVICHEFFIDEGGFHLVLLVR